MAIFIDLMNVEGAGLKHSALSNWANCFLVLFIWAISLADCVGLLGGVSGISQKPSEVLRSPAIINFFDTIQDLK